MAGLYTGKHNLEAANAGKPRESSEITVPYQPIESGYKIITPKPSRTPPKGKRLKLKIRVAEQQK